MQVNPFTIFGQTYIAIAYLEIITLQIQINHIHIFPTFSMSFPQISLIHFSFLTMSKIASNAVSLRC